MGVGSSPPFRLFHLPPGTHGGWSITQENSTQGGGRLHGLDLSTLHPWDQQKGGRIPTDYSTQTGGTLHPLDSST